MIFNTYSAANLFKTDEHVRKMMEAPIQLLNLEKIPSSSGRLHSSFPYRYLAYYMKCLLELR